MSISSKLFSKAQRYIPGGVNSPVRAWKSVGMDPVFIKKGEGSRIFDVDGNVYIDYVCSWGPLILGHAHPKVANALKKALKKGTSFGAPTELEVRLAELVTEAIPSIELVRMVNSGTEATMSAVRLARAYTKRSKVIKFDGCYHGHGDLFLVKAGSGIATLGIPGSPGVPDDLVKNTISLPYNDLNRVKDVVEKEGRDIACIIVEPVAGNMGVVLPKEGFLEGLRSLTHNEGIILIFDEVITGFRVSYGGAQGLYGVTPDLTCLGKIIGGGLPVGAYGGSTKIMSHIAPEGDVYQAGTLSGNPLAMTAGIETLKILRKRGIYETLEEKSQFLWNELKKAARKGDIPLQVNRVGSMGTLFVTSDLVTDFDTAKSSDTQMFAGYFREMLKRGIYWPPSQFEASFISLTHSEDDMEQTVKAAHKVFKILRK
jgi:glutamate-1-semialdehyde 2,1-aminomutase